MKSTTAYAAGIAGTCLAHLALIPILAVYGTSICPVLRTHGFGFGCVYNGVFISWIIAANALGMMAILKFGGRKVMAAILYGAIFAVGAMGLIGYLGSLVPAPTVTRLGTALFYSSVLLGILHLTIMDWLFTVRVRKTRPSTASLEAPGRLLLRWASGALWDFLPQAGALAVFAVYARRLGEGIATGELGDVSIHLAWKELALVSALLGGWLLAIRAFRLVLEYRLLQDVRDHLDALSRLDAGHLSQADAPAFWHDIFSGLNRATRIISDRARLIRGFSSYVAKDVVKQVLENDELKPEGKVCRTTILTSDLRDFTRFSNSMSAERVVQTLNIYFADMIEVFVAEQVQLDKFIGDGILAYVEPGAEPLAESNARGVRAALAMQEKLFETNSKLRKLGLPELKLGVAVHAGDLVLGNIGAPVKMQYTIIGDAVNVASRLEGFCKALGVGIVVSDGVYETLPANLKARFKDCGQQEVRGVASKVRLYGASPAADDSRKTA